MKFTSQHGNADKIHIYIDGEYAFTVYDDCPLLKNLCEGQEISDEELALLKNEAGFRSAYEKALRLLKMRDYGEKELLKKLSLSFPAEASERAVEKVKNYGYIDDEEYAKEVIRYLYEIKHYGIKRIRTELIFKGINPEIADNTLKTLDNNPIERIIVMLRSKYENGFQNEKEQKRFINKLIRLGYSFGDIKSAFRECGIDIPLF